MATNDKVLKANSITVFTPKGEVSLRIGEKIDKGRIVTELVFQFNQHDKEVVHCGLDNGEVLVFFGLPFVVDGAVVTTSGFQQQKQPIIVRP